MTERRIEKDGFAGIKPIPTAAAARERINADAERARHEALHYATGAALTAIQAGIEKAHHRATVFLNDWPRGTTDSMKKHAITALKEHLTELGYSVSTGAVTSQLQVNWEEAEEAEPTSDS